MAEQLVLKPGDVRKLLGLKTVAQASDLWDCAVDFPGVVDPALGKIVLTDDLRDWVNRRVAALKAAPVKPDAEVRGHDRDQALGDAAGRQPQAPLLLWENPRGGRGRLGKQEESAAPKP